MTNCTSSTPSRAALEGQPVVPGLITTVITAYNKGPYLAEAIDSALAQDYPNQEVIVVDDGSTDDSAQVASSYGDRIRLIRQRNLGQSAAKNRGVVEGRGEFVAYLDGDDRWRPGKLRKQAEVFARNPAVALVYSDQVIFDERRVVCPSMQTRRDFHRGRVLDRIIVDNFIPFSSAMMRRDRLIEVGMFDEGVAIAPDFDLWLRLARSYEVDYVDEVLVEYREIDSGDRIGARFQHKFPQTQAIIDAFVARYYGGKYPHPRALAVGKANRHTARADTRLASGENLSALADYLRAVRLDPLDRRRYFRVLRGLIPNRVAGAIAGHLAARRSRDSKTGPAAADFGRPAGA